MGLAEGVAFTARRANVPRSTPHPESPRAGATPAPEEEEEHLMAIIGERLTKCPIERGPLDDQRRERRACARLFAALAIAVGSVLGCGGGGGGDSREDVESVQSAFSLTQTFTFGGTQRFLGTNTVCAQQCVKIAPLVAGPPGSGLPRIQCLQYAWNCNVPPVSGGLFADANALASNVIFPAYNEGPSWTYSGCGPQAGQDVLNYYGVQMPIAEVGQYVPAFTWSAGSDASAMATCPDDLASGLQNLLNDQVAANHFVVSRHTGVDPYTEIPNAINSGNPIILLVDGGYHYQTATGYDSSTGRAFVTDFAGNDQWKYVSDLGMQISSTLQPLSIVPCGWGGLGDDTIINVNYVNGSMIYDPPNSSVGVNVCYVDGYPMHCCPNGYAMVGADPNNNIFSCGALDTPGYLGPPTLDSGTVRNNMHACPDGQVMVGLRVDWNLLACQALPAGSVTAEYVDSSTQNGYPMHACDGGPYNTAVMSGIRVDQDLLTCATTNRIH